MSDEQIQHVSDTALLAAGWRAMESGRSDALFNDPLAAGLAGERGLRIARTRPDGWWVVAIRAVVVTDYFSPRLLAYYQKHLAMARGPGPLRSAELGGVLRRTRLARQGDPIPR